MKNIKEELKAALVSDTAALNIKIPAKLKERAFECAKSIDEKATLTDFVIVALTRACNEVEELESRGTKKKS